MVMDEGRRALELIELMQSSPGHQVDETIRSLEMSVWTFEMNFRTLDQTVRSLEAQTDLWHMPSRDRTELAMYEVVRLLHNVVAAAKTLVDHSRIVSRRLIADDDMTQKTYQDRVNRDFVDDHLVQFVEDLRNYSLHKKLPPLGLSYTADDDRQRFYLPKDGFGNFNWSASAREFFDAAEPRIDFHAVLSAYRGKVMDFQRWLKELLRDLHRDSLGELKAYEDEYMLIELRQGVRHWNHQPTDDLGLRVLNTFMQVLDPADLRELQTIDDPGERLREAVRRFESATAVPKELKDQLLALVPD